MQRARFPTRQLNSRTIKGAASGYLCPVFVTKCSILRTKCVCKVQEDGFEEAWNNVCRTKRLICLFVISMVFSTCWMYEIHQISLINNFCFLHFSGMKNVAFSFEFSAIATERLRKQTGKQKPNEDHQDSRYDPPHYVLSIKAT